MVVPSRGEAAVFDFDRRPAIPGAPPADSARSVDRITPVIMRPAATAVSDPTKPVTASVSTDFFCNSRQASALERGNGLTALVVKQPCNVVRSQTTLAKASPPIGLTDGTFLGLQIDDVDLPQDGAEARLEFFVVGPDSGNGAGDLAGESFVFSAHWGTLLRRLGNSAHRGCGEISRLYDVLLELLPSPLTASSASGCPNTRNDCGDSGVLVPFYLNCP
jgi:hypothetical protein